MSLFKRSEPTPEPKQPPVKPPKAKRAPKAKGKTQDLTTRDRKKVSYGEAEVQRALMAVAAANGNTRLAERNLAEDGMQIDHSTLWEWQTKRHVDQYQRIRAELLPRIREQQADAHRALEHRQLEASLEGTDLIAGRLGGMEDKDLINAVGKLDIGSGIHAEKALLHDGQPTQIVSRDASEVLRKLRHRGVFSDGKLVEEESEAVEVQS